jgi:hypothetical protein
MMTDAVQIAMIVATPATIVGIGTFVLGLVNKNATREVHFALNSRLTELLAATKAIAHAEGVQEAINAQVAQNAVVDAAVAKSKEHEK